MEDLISLFTPFSRKKPWEKKKWREVSYTTWIALTKCHSPGGLNSRHLFFIIVLKNRKLKIKCQLIWFLVRTLFLACAMPFSIFPHLAFPWWVDMECRVVKIPLLTRFLILSWGPLPHNIMEPNYLLIIPSPKTITLGVRDSMCKLGEGSQACSL